MDSYAVLAYIRAIHKGDENPKVGLLTYNNAYGKSIHASSKEYAAKHNIDIVAIEQFPPQSLNLNTELQRLKEMEAEYIDLEACMTNTNTPGPIVEFTSFNDYPFQLELALYYYALQTVFIDTDVEDFLPLRNCISDREFLRHEFGHHVLYLNGVDPGHVNPKFAQCDALGPKTCNGEYCED